MLEVKLPVNRSKRQGRRQAGGIGAAEPARSFTIMYCSTYPGGSRSRGVHTQSIRESERTSGCSTASASDSAQTDAQQLSAMRSTTLADISERLSTLPAPCGKHHIPLTSSWVSTTSASDSAQTDAQYSASAHHQGRAINFTNHLLVVTSALLLQLVQHILRLALSTRRQHGICVMRSKTQPVDQLLQQYCSSIRFDHVLELITEWDTIQQSLIMQNIALVCLPFMFSCFSHHLWVMFPLKVPWPVSKQQLFTYLEQ